MEEPVTPCRSIATYRAPIHLLESDRSVSEPSCKHIHGIEYVFSSLLPTQHFVVTRVHVVAHKRADPRIFLRSAPFLFRYLKHRQAKLVNTSSCQQPAQCSVLTVPSMSKSIHPMPIVRPFVSTHVTVHQWDTSVNASDCAMPVKCTVYVQSTTVHLVVLPLTFVAPVSCVPFHNSSSMLLSWRRWDQHNQHSNDDIWTLLGRNSSTHLLSTDRHICKLVLCKCQFLVRQRMAWKQK